MWCFWQCYVSHSNLAAFRAADGSTQQFESPNWISMIFPVVGIFHRFFQIFTELTCNSNLGNLQTESPNWISKLNLQIDSMIYLGCSRSYPLCERFLTYQSSWCFGICIHMHGPHWISTFEKEKNMIRTWREIISH